MLMQVIRVVNILFNAYSFVLVAYALMSWFPNARSSKLGQVIQRLAQPYLSFFDRFIPPIAGISFNVIIALFVLQYAQRGIIYLLLSLAY